MNHHNFRSNSTEGNDFTLLGDTSDDVKTDNLSHKIKVGLVASVCVPQNNCSAGCLVLY